MDRWQSSYLSRYQGIVLDCDGVIWYHGQLMPGVEQTIRHLESRSLAPVFLSNTSTLTSVDLQQCLAKQALEVPVSRILTSLNCVVEALQALAQEGQWHPQTQHVLYFGSPALGQELADAGFTTRCLDTLLPAASLSTEDLVTLPLDPRIQVIVGGCDLGFSYAKAALICRYLQADPRRLFLATSQDASYPITERVCLPATGSCLAMITTTCGRYPELCGKPSPRALALARQRLNLDDQARLLVVGDNLDSDIALGRQAPNVDTLLVETGLHRRQDAQQRPPSEQPTFVLPSLADLCRANSEQ